MISGWIPWILAATAVLVLVGLWLIGRGRSGNARPGTLDLRRQAIVLGHAQNPGGSGDRYDAFGFHDPGDTHLLRSLGLVGVVADGFGSAELGASASSAAVSRFLDTVRKAAREDGRGLSAQAVLRRALTEADTAVREVGARAAPEERVGAALAAIAVGPNGMHWVSVGDSRVYLFRSGRLHQVTVDQTFRTLLARSIAQEQISPAEAAAKKEREALTCALGTADKLEIDGNVRPYPLQPGDRVIVCSVGLHRTLSSEQIAAAIAGAVDSCSKALLTAAAARLGSRGGSITVIDVLLQAPQIAVQEAVAEAPRTQPGPSQAIARGGTTQPSGATS